MENSKYAGNVPVVYCYRYMWKDQSGKICVKYVTDILAKHDEFMKALVESSEVISAAREYIHQINFDLLGFTETIKTEKGEKKDETA